MSDLQTPRQAEGAAATSLLKLLVALAAAAVILAQVLPGPPPAVGGAGAVGYGSETTGGAGGRVISVSTAAQLSEAVSASGPRVVQVAAGLYEVGQLRVKNPYLTLEGKPGAVLKGAILIVTSQVVVRGLSVLSGDENGDPATLDAVTINGMSGTVSNVVLDHLTMLWGPDIGGLAILGDVRDVTVQHSIMGEGLYLSRHPEATVAQGGHSLAANVSQLEAGSPPPARLTFWRNLFTTSEARMPRLQGAECVDLVNNVIYNWGTDAAHGNPRSANLVNNWFRAGPETTRAQVWRAQTSQVAPELVAGSVYLAGNVADGFAYKVDAPASQLAANPRCGGLSVAPEAADAAYAGVIANAGATAPLRDAVDVRVIDNVTSRKGSFVNGAGYAAPNPYWP